MEVKIKMAWLRLKTRRQISSIGRQAWGITKTGWGHAKRISANYNSPQYQERALRTTSNANRLMRRII